jgi:hypothetical protein
MLTTTSAHHCRRFEIGGGAAVAGEVSISASSPPVPASSMLRSVNLSIQLFYLSIWSNNSSNKTYAERYLRSADESRRHRPCRRCPDREGYAKKRSPYRSCQPRNPENNTPTRRGPNFYDLPIMPRSDCPRVPYRLRPPAGIGVSRRRSDYKADDNNMSKFAVSSSLTRESTPLGGTSPMSQFSRPIAKKKQNPTRIELLRR